MKPEPIETAPKDREILVYGEWSWESLDGNMGTLKWRVAVYEAELATDYDSVDYCYIDGFKSITNNPYADYSKGILWCELPTVGA